MFVKIASGVVLCALLAGCGGGGGKSSPSSAAESKDALYLSVIRGDFPATVADSTLVQLAHGICEDFGSGSSWVDEVAVLVNQGDVPARTAGAVIGTAVRVYCPDQTDQLPG